MWLGGWYCGVGGVVVDLFCYVVIDGGVDSRVGIRDV